MRDSPVADWMPGGHNGFYPGRIHVATNVLPGVGGNLDQKSKAQNHLMKYRLVFVVSFQALVVLIAYTGAFYIRFDLTLPREYLALFLVAVPAHLVLRLAAYSYYGIFSSSWRFASMRDLFNIGKGTALGSVAIILFLVFTMIAPGFPRSVLILEPLLSLVLTGGARLVARHYYQSRGRVTQKRIKHILVVGAGKAGFHLLKEIQTNSQLGIHIVGFVDDNPFKKKTSIEGVPVLGSSEDIPELVKRLTIDEIIIAIPSANYKEIVRIKDIAEKTTAKTVVLPSLGELIRDQKFTSQLRDVSCEELLGRGVIKFCRESDHKVLENEISGKTVLVTGAGGSIGSELCRQVAQFNPSLLIMYERYENGLYEIEVDLRKDFPDLPILPVLGDILDAEKMGRVLRDNRVDLIYHAAAFKHVPMMEREPLEATRNNVFGTLTVAKLSLKHGVPKFVLISTDKAVRPTNVMGTTKRVSELLLKAMTNGHTKFIAVRFGNVLGSNGSVIPLFKKQIAAGAPVTVTHPEATRYFMSISEAVQLVMVAGTMGEGGEVFLLDMGEPVKILDLAHNLIRLSGLEPDQDIDVVFTGLRAGEKLHEELYWQGEGITATENKKITVWKSNGLGKEYLFTQLARLEDLVHKRETQAVVAVLSEIVPEAKLSPAKFIQFPVCHATQAVRLNPKPVRSDTSARAAAAGERPLNPLCQSN
jgi:FlaA1/EpsC-like NDP-sugar epimerase